MKIKHIILLLCVVALICIMFVILIPKSLFKDTQLVEDITVQYEGEVIELTEPHYELLMNELSKAQKQFQFHPNKTHLLEDTYNVRIIYEHQPHHLVIKNEEQWGYSNTSYKIITDTPLYQVLATSTMELVINEIGESYILVSSMEDEHFLATASISDETLIEKQGKKITISDLAIGDHIYLEHSGEVEESYPAQILHTFRIEVKDEMPEN